MCCCGKNNVNGQPGYSWDGRSVGVHAITAPEVDAGDEILIDEPGRCDKVRGLDCHCHHFALVKSPGNGRYIACRHGGGTVCYELPHRAGIDFVFAGLDSDGRYWLMYAIWTAASKAAKESRANTERTWAEAVAEKRTKIRRRHGRRYVEIVPATAV
jgi:hypothetical protein